MASQSLKLKASGTTMTGAAFVSAQEQEKQHCGEQSAGTTTAKVISGKRAPNYAQLVHMNAGE
jgi:hypothetical protein